MMWWLREGREEKEWYLLRSKLEVPPKGYTGSLKGTGWDPDVVLEEYDRAAGNVMRGPAPMEE